MERMERLIKTVLLLALLPSMVWGATKHIDEDFDDQALDSRLRVYGNDWTALTENTGYTLSEAGNGGSGYCITSGNVQAISVNWGVLGIGNVPNPWPTDEFYVSYWTRYTGVSFSHSDPNIKIGYPHWSGTNNALEIRISNTTGAVQVIPYNGGGLFCASYGIGSCSPPTGGRYATVYSSASGIFDGNWHHLEYYVNMATGDYHVWWDSALIVDQNVETTWAGQIYYLNAGSIDADGSETFTRQIDDIEMWDGMPDSTPAPAPPTISNVTISNGRVQ